MACFITLPVRQYAKLGSLCYYRAVVAVCQSPGGFPGDGIVTLYRKEDCFRSFLNRKLIWCHRKMLMCLR